MNISPIVRTAQRVACAARRARALCSAGSGIGFPIRGTEIAMRNSQRGLSSFGVLVVVAAAVAAGYYAYQSITGADEARSCKSAFSSCMQSCRRTTTEAPAAQACQDACTRDQVACERAAK